MINHYRLFLIIFIILLLSREFFAYKKNVMLKYILTPLVSAVVVISAIFSFKLNNSTIFSFIIVTGLVLSLAGDTILMIEEANLFIEGLLFFLLTQIAYTCAMAINYTFETWNVFPALVLVILIFVFYNIIRKKASKIKYLILIYMFVISAMVYFAIASFNKGVLIKAFLLSAGASLFVISDMLLAINEFFKKIPHSTVFVWLFYAPSQFLIGLSCYYS